MPSCGLAPGARPVAAACFRAVRRRLAYVRGHECTLAALRGFRREVAARACARLRRETRLQLQAMRQLLHALCDSSAKKGQGDAASSALALPVDPLRQKATSACTLHQHRQHSKRVCSHSPLDAPPNPTACPSTGSPGMAFS